MLKGERWYFHAFENYFDDWWLMPTGFRLFVDTELIGCLVTSIIPSESFSKPLTSLKLLTCNEDTQQRQTEQEFVFKVKQTNKLSMSDHTRYYETHVSHL